MYQRGDDVVVRFAGRNHQGEVIEHHGQWVLCRILIDPTWDYGDIGPRLDPTTTVCVRHTQIQHTQPPPQTTTM